MWGWTFLFCFSNVQWNLGLRFDQWGMFGPHVVSAAVRSGAVVLLLLIHCCYSQCMWEFFLWPLYCVALGVVSSLAVSL